MTAEFAAMWMASTLCWLTIAKETYSAGFRFSAQTSSFVDRKVKPSMRQL